LLRRAVPYGSPVLPTRSLPFYYPYPSYLVLVNPICLHGYTSIYTTYLATPALTAYTHLPTVLAWFCCGFLTVQFLRLAAKENFWFLRWFMAATGSSAGLRGSPVLVLILSNGSFLRWREDAVTFPALPRLRRVHCPGQRRGLLTPRGYRAWLTHTLRSLTTPQVLGYTITHHNEMVYHIHSHCRASPWRFYLRARVTTAPCTRAVAFPRYLPLPLYRTLLTTCAVKPTRLRFRRFAAIPHWFYIPPHYVAAAPMVLVIPP